MTVLRPAPNGYPIKLVRDRTHEIINATGKPGDLFYAPTIKDLDRWLRQKLLEEVGEYIVAPSVSELADVLAVVEGLAKVHGLTLSELRKKMDSDPRGGFLTGQMMYGRHPEFDQRDEAA